MIPQAWMDYLREAGVLKENMSDKMQMQIEQTVYLVREKGEVAGLIFGPMQDVRTSEKDVQFFATDFGNIPVRIDKNMKPNEWALVMGPLNTEARKAAAVKEIEIELVNFVGRVNCMQTIDHNTDTLRTLTRAVLILLERTDRKDGIK